jgi:hypothetical protein
VNGAEVFSEACIPQSFDAAKKSTCAGFGDSQELARYPRFTLTVA